MTPLHSINKVEGRGEVCHAGARQKQRGNFMISNERPSPFHQQPYHQHYAPQPPRPFVQEDTLKSEQIQIERKSFLLTLKENPRGRFLRISEEVGGKRNSIIVPAPGLEDFKRLLDEMITSSNKLPPKLAPTA
ncbi:MAG: PUR family DNA/RNA-binding protein [Verrucomicrobiota bacterium]|jgi:hypothetical protein